jgi:hypothetical protein
MNIDKARQALAAIRKYPENHDQGQWVNDRAENWYSFPCAADNSEAPPCGTTLCMAGWVAFQQAPTGTSFNPWTSTFTLPNGNAKTMKDFAVDELELTADQCSALFFGANNADELEALIDYIEAHPDADVHELYPEVLGREV